MMTSIVIFVSRGCLVFTCTDMIDCRGGVSWVVVCNALVTAYSETIKESSSIMIFDVDSNSLVFETTLRLPAQKPCTSNTNPCDISYWEHDHILEADPSALKSDISRKVKLRAVIVPHPVYSVPCPYIERVWDDSGEVYSINKSQMVLDEVRHLQSQCTQRIPSTNTEKEGSDFSEFEAGEHEPVAANSNKTANDNRYYEFGRLMPESHPISGLPCFSMHLCQLPEIIQLSERTIQEYRQNCNGSNDLSGVDSTARLYLLNWCSIVGPHFGMFISAAEYKHMVVKLLEQS